MTDPFEPLRDLDARAPMDAPSPADVRRRGDQIRRRRRAATSLAAAVAIAAVAVPTASLVGGDDRTAPAPVAPGPSEPNTATDPATPPTTEATPTDPTDPTSQPGDPSAVPTTIPDDFPLTAGWPDPADAEDPERALTGPSPDLEDPLFDYAACGEALPLPEPADRLRAIYRSAEDTRTRQLLTFADAQQAVAFIGDVVAFYRACPAEPGGPQSPAYQRAVVETTIGGQSYAIGAFPPADQPVGSTQVLHAIRLGSAVLLDTTEGEGGTSDDVAALTQQRAEVMTTASSDPVAALCRFTDAGC